jgi:hypothetical protein
MKKYTSLIWCYHSKETIKKKWREYFIWTQDMKTIVKHSHIKKKE